MSKPFKKIVHLEISKGRHAHRLVRAVCHAEKHGVLLVIPEQEYKPPQQPYANCVRDRDAVNCEACLAEDLILVGFYWVKRKDVPGLGEE